MANPPLDLWCSVPRGHKTTTKHNKKRRIYLCLISLWPSFW